MKRRWSKDAVLNALKVVYTETGQAPSGFRSYHDSRNKMSPDKKRRTPCGETVREYFPTMREAWAQTGVDSRKLWTHWTDQEVEFLRTNAGYLTQAEMARYLDRTHASVATKVYHLKGGRDVR